MWRKSFHSSFFLFLFVISLFEFFNLLNLFDLHFSVLLFKPQLFQQIIGLFHSFVLFFSGLFLLLLLLLLTLKPFEMLVISFLDAFVIFSWHFIVMMIQQFFYYLTFGLICLMSCAIKIKSKKDKVVIKKKDGWYWDK